MKSESKGTAMNHAEKNRRKDNNRQGGAKAPACRRFPAPNLPNETLRFIKLKSYCVKLR